MALIPKSVELSTGVRLPYVESGGPSGLPVIFLHGFLDSWRSFEPALSYLPGSIRAISLTQRGHGDASRPDDGYSIVHMAGDVRAFMDALGIPHAVIAGHSMGSMVALRFAIDWPGRARGLVLIGAAANLTNAPEARKFWDATLSSLSDPVDEAFVRQLTADMLVQPVPPDFLEAAVRDSAKVPASVWRGVLESRWRGEGDFSEQLGQVQAPTLILWGDRDPRYPLAGQEALARALPDAELVTYSGAGHLLHWEEPERFASDLVRFVKCLLC